MPEENSQQQEPIKVHYLYRYHVEAFEMLVPEFEGPIDLVPGSISMIYIDKDYDKHIYPIFSITFAINPKLREFIAMRKDDIKFRIRLQCDIYNVKSGSVLPESSEDVFNTIFIAVIDDNMPFMNAEKYNEVVDSLKLIASNGGTIEQLGGANMVADHRELHTYYFYAERDLYNSKNLINDVYNDANLPTICADILGKNGFDALLMSPADNQDNISQCIIPPMNLLNLFKYLSDNYGLHVTGTTTFFDYRCVYILNKTGHPNCVEEGEYPTTIFEIYPTKESESWLPGTVTCDEEQTYYINPEPKNVAMRSPSSTNDHITGNNLVMINSKNNSSAKIGGTGRQRGSGNTRVDNNTNQNDYTRTNYANAVSEENLKTMITLYDVFHWALTPNKEFIVNFLDTSVDPSYSGYYRPTRTQFIFSKNGEGLSLQANLFMVKKDDISKQVAESTEQEVSPGTPNPNSVSDFVSKISLPSLG